MYGHLAEGQSSPPSIKLSVGSNVFEISPVPCQPVKRDAMCHVNK